MKRLKQKILFLLASEKDFFYHRDFSYRPYNYLYHRLPKYQDSSIRDACLQMVQSGELDRLLRNREALFRLTSHGRTQLSLYFPQMARFNKSWDIVWRIAILLPGNNKASLEKTHQAKLLALRKMMLLLGFKPLSRGVYLCPMPVADKLKSYLIKQKLNKSIAIFEANKLIMGDNAVFGHHLWGLKNLAEQYAKFITDCNRLLSAIKTKKDLQDKDKGSYCRLLDTFFLLLQSDPALPKKLIGFKWPFSEAKDVFFKLQKECIDR